MFGERTLCVSRCRDSNESNILASCAEKEEEGKKNNSITQRMRAALYIYEPMLFWELGDIHPRTDGGNHCVRVRGV